MCSANLFTAGAPIYLLSNSFQPYAGAPDLPAPGRPHVCQLEPGKVHCVSNSSMDDDDWPKVRWLRDQVAAAVQEASGKWAAAARTGEACADGKHDEGECEAAEEEAAAVHALRDRLAAAMSREDPFDEAKGMAFLERSSLTPDKELGCQRVFVPHREGKGEPPNETFGTRSQIIVLRTRSGRVYFFYRETDSWPVPGPWISVTASDTGGHHGRRDIV